MASRPVHPILVAFLALLLVGTCQARPAPGKAASSSLSSAAKGAVVDGITDIYNFGDSISDTGNFLALMEHTVAPPYRWCGRVVSAAREVLEMSATRVVIPGNFPLGCAPSYLAAVDETERAAYDGNGCLVGLNLFAQMHNVLLQQGIRELRRS
ncbi:hypothetical protein OsJ_07429 [Oryza sativa Japonica Group]|uniref:GDSL esterase/lipase n=1 Tax=Oryza sativa subsp. japonica TaxID=39947 RepID=A3A8T6_ORYSJ|nr:hypothetical protein OsJ_07429 [Oryza sativa Japonica Group]